jgi:hypothetical protein
MGVLLMLLTIGGVIVAAVALVVAAWMKKAWLSSFIFGGVVVWFAFYFAMLFGTSYTSDEKDLAFNEPKKFCGFYLDCHLHAAVNDVRRTSKIGNKTARGEFYVVTVHVFSDAGKATLSLGTVDAHVIDANGASYNRDMLAEAELMPQPEFEKMVGPEESFVKEIVFDLPPDVKNPRFDIKAGDPIDRIIEGFLINDEDSVLHKRTLFKLEGPNTAEVRPL